MYDPSNMDQPNPQLFDDISSGGAAHGYSNEGYGRDQLLNNDANTRSSNSVYRNFQQTNMYGNVNSATKFVQDPLVANMAMQFGQDLMGQGRQIVDEKLEKIVNVSRVKYYFAVDTKYVLNKLKLLFFPYTHSDWNIKFNSEDEEPVQPRYDINAPDLYIPLMAFVTYILVAGLSLGLQDRFSPEFLSMQATWAVIWLLLELGVTLIAFHILSIQSKMQTLHLLALSSYKYVGMICCLLGGIVMQSLGYYSALLYCSFSFIIFMFRALRCHVQGDSESMQGYSAGTKRRFYLLIIISSLQPLMMWWLTRNLALYTQTTIHNPLPTA